MWESEKLELEDGDKEGGNFCLIFNMSNFANYIHSVLLLLLFFKLFHLKVCYL